MFSHRKVIGKKTKWNYLIKQKRPLRNKEQQKTMWLWICLFQMTQGRLKCLKTTRCNVKCVTMAWHYKTWFTKRSCHKTGSRETVGEHPDKHLRSYNRKGLLETQILFLAGFATVSHKPSHEFTKCFLKTSLLFFSSDPRHLSRMTIALTAPCLSFCMPCSVTSHHTLCLSSLFLFT